MLSELLELSSRAKEEGTAYAKKRFMYPQVSRHLGERVFLALVGPRGVGKTIMLKQLHSEADASFYLSLDTEKLEKGLFETAKELSDKGVKTLLIDEAHHYPGVDRELKKMHDFLPLGVVLTSSSALSLHESAFDLSRRVRLIHTPPFSFREFVFFEKSENLPPLPFAALLSRDESRKYYGRVIHAERLFDSYLQGRNYAFTIGKTDFIPLFRNILETIINNDLLLAGRASPEEALEMKKMLEFIGKSPAEGISYSAVARNLGITKYKSEKYAALLEDAFVLKRVFAKGSNVNKEPKILLSLPYRLLYKAYDDCVGALREDFFVEAVNGAGYDVNYLKSKRGEKTPDYVCGSAVFEIGGAGKTPAQFKGFAAKEKIILTHPGALDKLKRPLFFAGMLGNP
ncbi:ATP-binding protein [Candidatus Micrarchaeota archaeon]|nr:ATP-binding protein [Candidatus Micrarchaeota archaeon]